VAVDDLCGESDVADLSQARAQALTAAMLPVVLEPPPSVCSSTQCMLAAHGVTWHLWWVESLTGQPRLDGELEMSQQALALTTQTMAEDGVIMDSLDQDI